MARWTARAVRALPWPLGEASRRRAIRERLARLPAGGYAEPEAPAPPTPTGAGRVPPQPGPEREDDLPDPVATDGTTPG